MTKEAIMLVHPLIRDELDRIHRRDLERMLAAPRPAPVPGGSRRWVRGSRLARVVAIATAAVAAAATTGAATAAPRTCHSYICPSAAPTPPTHTRQVHQARKHHAPQPIDRSIRPYSNLG